jgi:tetratricopeptide (TPR) repeat protein
MAFNIYTGISHYRSERITGLMLKARSMENWEAVIERSREAESYWHHLDPSSVPIAFYRGVAYYQLKRFDKAEQAFLEAHHYSPFNFHVLNNLATVGLEKKDYDGSITWLREALRINPRFEDALYNLSYCFAMQGAFEKARQTLESVPGESARKDLFRQEILKMQNQNIK